MRKWAALLAVALLLSLLTACLTQSGQEEGGARLWFITPSAQQKIQVTPALASCPYEGQETVSGLLAALLSGPPADSELATPIPAGTRVVGWRLADGVVNVEMSDTYAALAGIDLTLADYCLTLTLTQLPGVEGVRITVSGAGHSFQNRRVLRAEDVVLADEEKQGEENFEKTS